MESRAVVWLEVVAVVLIALGAGVAAFAALGGTVGVAAGCVTCGALLLVVAYASDVLRERPRR